MCLAAHVSVSLCLDVYVSVSFCVCLFMHMSVSLCVSTFIHDNNTGMNKCMITAQRCMHRSDIYWKAAGVRLGIYEYIYDSHSYPSPAVYLTINKSYSLNEQANMSRVICNDSNSRTCSNGNNRSNSISHNKTGGTRKVSREYNCINKQYKLVTEGHKK